MKSLSIIVPVFNVEHYLEKCLLSLENQDIPHDEFEIICVNDGSSDNSTGVIKRFQEKFNNVILIDQNNQGVSRARNNGIDKACGKYLLFVDADDFIDTCCFNRILKNADKFNTQVSILGFTILDEYGRTIHSKYYESLATKIYVGVEAYFLAREDGRFDADRMWGVLFDRDFFNLNNLRYLPDVPYLEDGEFIDRILCLAEHCIFDRYSFYYRTTRSGSATQSNLFFSDKATRGFILAACNLKRFQQEQNLSDIQREFLNQPIVQFVVLAVTSSTGFRLIKKFISTIKSLRGAGMRKINLTGCNETYQRYGKAYNLSPYLCGLLIVIYPRLNRVYLSNVLKKIFSKKYVFVLN
jgi:glycosyltransferase involved in cell wall biosynthesis